MCRLCVARFSSRHVILTTLDGANGSPSPEEAVFPPQWFLAPRQPSDRSWRVLAPKVPRPSGRSDSPESACERFLRVSPAGHLKLFAKYRLNLVYYYRINEFKLTQFEKYRLRANDASVAAAPAAAPGQVQLDLNPVGG